MADSNGSKAAKPGATPRDVFYAALKEEAESGDLQSAQEMLRAAASWLRDDRPLTSSVRAYVAKVLDDAIKHDDGLLVINRKGRRGIPRHFETVPRVFKLFRSVHRMPEKQSRSRGRPRKYTPDEARWIVSRVEALKRENRHQGKGRELTNIEAIDQVLGEQGEREGRRRWQKAKQMAKRLSEWRREYS